MNFTHNTFIQWFNASEVKPSKDGNYLCMTTPGSFMITHFMTKYQLFNVNDDCTDYALNVTWWTPIPELPYKEDENEA